MNIEQKINNIIQSAENLKGPVLSVYLSVDPSEPINAGRGFETILKSRIKQLKGRVSENESKAFLAAADAVSRYVLNLTPGSKGLICFYDAASGSLLTEQFMVPFEPDVSWAELPNLRPLLESLNEHKRYGVLLTDRGSSRWFRIFFGEIEEDTRIFSDLDVRRVKSVGSDHLRSQPQADRTADLHALRHLKKIAQRITETEKELKYSKLILSGPDEAVHEFFHLLPESIQRLVVEFQTIQLNTPADEVLTETFRVKRESEMSDENALVENVIEKSNYGKKPKARLGISAVLDALRKSRVDSLVYSVSLDLKGSECRQCNVLFDGSPDQKCPYCAAAKEPAGNLIEQILMRVKHDGGRIMPVGGLAAERLNSKGGVGAMLRY